MAFIATYFINPFYSYFQCLITLKKNQPLSPPISNITIYNPNHVFDMDAKLTWTQSQNYFREDVKKMKKGWLLGNTPLNLSDP